MSGTVRPVALVTGASSGIGAELARAFVRGRHDVVLVARRRDRLEALAATLGGHARVLAEDLADPGAPARLLAETGPVDVLVNNAGFGALGRFVELPLERQLGIVQVNVVALTALTRLYLPPMVARGHGRVLNVASTAAFQPGPGLAVYGATKAFVLSLSEALHAELEGTGVTVTCLCPGATESEFAATAGMGDSRLFRHAMSAAEVARQGFAATMAGRRLVVTGTLNQMSAMGVRFAPRGLALNIARKLLLG
ncbi:SDR family NAD(P)-dependent oxidoreductase [Limobrevibacterium gyesilva]|uniref:SDR family oxidoreductase n=1 Tax=Limobrevibacterium gyesilva TaxID=2991712 RepID=A0AA41YQ43_9PROT|nr:SDR family oxidoreductase [Limobrevibacterium gyesilva]MCW3473472.1 SDR family oxidoreductase [Limobrevibacterium gyesilva]